MRVILTYLLICLCTTTVYAQRYPFFNLSVENGLIQSQVRAIVQDRYGHVWIGTYGGLSMYDGSNFTNYTVRSGLLNNTVNALAIDHEDNIWIGGPNGVSMYDGKHFKHFIFKAPENTNANSVVELKVDSDNKVWARAAGAIYYIENGKSKELTLPNKTATATAILPTSEALLIATVGGRIYKHTTTGWDSIFYNQQNISNDRIYTTDLYEDKKQTVWLTTNAGLYHLNNDTIYKAFIKSANINSWPFLFNISEDSTGTLWMGTTGVLQYKDSVLTAYNKDDGFTNSQVTDILTDREGNIWFGTDGQGAYRFSGGSFSILDEEAGLGYEQVMSIGATPSGRVYLGTYLGGLYYYEKGVVQQLPMPIKGNLSISAINVKSEYDFWVGTNVKGLWHYKGGEFKQYSASVVGSSIITSLYRDATNKLWIGTSNGATVYANDSFQVLPLGNSSAVAFATLGKDSTLIATGYNGLKLYHHNNVYPYTTGTAADSASPQCLLKQGDKLWVGTSDNGVICYDLISKKAQVINKSSGLESDFIYNITTDKDGNIWVGTGFGIHEITMKGDTPYINFYGKGKGIKGMESNQNAVYNMPDGKIWFGTTKGALIYNPANDITQPQPVSIVLQSIKLFGDYINDTSYYDSVSSWYNVPYQLHLPYQKNNITFTFKGITMSGPEQIRYRYRIEGLDAPWSDWTELNSVTYSALPPGDYTLKVACRTSNSGNIKELSYPFTIVTPFHKTSWFRMLILGTCILLGVTIQYIVNKRKENRLALLERLRREEQSKVRERTAEDFHDEVGNKLTRINVLTTVLRSKITEHTPDTLSILDKIQENAGELYNGTRDILWSLKPSNDNLYEIIHRIRDFGGELFSDADINFIFAGSNEKWKQYKLPLDVSRNLIMIFKEAMNNTLKYAGATTVKFEAILKEHDNLQVLFSDNGKGFDIETVTRGNGLQNMQNRAKRIDGRLYVESHEGKGTTISLNFKLKEKVKK